MIPQDEIDFYAWWAEHGRFIDPDTSDVDWFDKRKELCALAFMAARRPVTSQMMGAAIQNAKARHLTRVDGRNNELQAALSPSGEAPKCKICNHAKHTERCEKDAPNAQFRCACAGECRHGKDALYCRDCKGEAPKEGKNAD